MATIVTRAGKGSALTHTELDANFTNINLDIATKPSTVFTGVFTTPSPSALAVTDDLLFSVEPSLRLDFVNSHRLDSRITFSRVSSATRTSQSGLVETVASGAPRFDFDPVTKASRGLLIEESRTNLLTYSENFDNAVWVPNQTSVIPNVTVSPKGTLTAYKLVETTATSQHLLSQVSATTSGLTYTYSVYAKAAEWTSFSLQIGSGGPQGTFNLSTKTTTNSSAISSTIQDVGNGWFRCVVVGVSNGNSNNYIYETSSSYLGDGVSGMYFWGAQLELGAFPTSYIPSAVTHTGRASTATYIDSAGTVQTAANNVPRFQYNPQNLTVAPFLLLEGVATNLCTYSQDFTQTAWAATNSTKTTGVADPAGGVTAATITSTSANGVLQNGSAVVAIGTTYTVSIWLRRRTGTGVVGIRAVENANIPVTITSAWARYSLTVTATQTAGRVGVFCSTIGDGIDFWGGQLETGTFASSYIPTIAATTRAADTSTSAQTTRAAESATITGTNFSSWYNPIEGTLFAKLSNITKATTAQYPRLIALTGADANTDEISFYIRTQDVRTGTAIGSVTSAGITTFDPEPPATVIDSWSAAIAYKSNDTAFAASGLVDATDTTVTIPTCNQLRIFGSASYQLMPSGYVCNLIYYPIRLSNTTLQALTK